MKKRFLASLLALALAFSFSSCAKSGKEDPSSASSSPDDPDALYTEEELDDIEIAKDVITKWFGYMNDANYTEARKLMSADYAAEMGYNDMADGESMGHFDFSFIEGGTLLTMDDMGNIVVCVNVAMVSSDDPNDRSETAIYVSCYEIGAVITSIGASLMGGGGQQNTQVDRGALVKQLAVEAFSAAEVSMADLIARSEMIADGEYTESDDNEIVTAVNMAISGETQGNDLYFRITVNNGAVSLVEVTLSDDSSSVSASYPIASEQ